MFQNRAEIKELIDLGPDYYTLEEYHDCMMQLFRINQFFGFFRDTVAVLKKTTGLASICDIGCGNGLFLLHLHQIFPQMKMLGLDISAEAIQCAHNLQTQWQKNLLATQNIEFVLDKLPLNLADNSVDVILATLVCHHLSNEELIIFLRKISRSARQIVILNDLHRHFLSYYGYALITPWLFPNRLIRHDGLISIRRGFIYQEWRNLLQQAGIENFQIKWRFPFRWQILIYTNYET